MILALLLAQVTPVQPMPKGTALPPPGTDEAQVMAPIQTLLSAIDSNDPAAVLRATRPDGGATVVMEEPRRGITRVGWAEFAAGMKSEPGRFRETLGQPAIEYDGDVAMVWVPYTLLRDGKPDHCGYDHFDLVRDGTTWKILNVTWSQRTSGCVAQ